MILKSDHELTNTKRKLDLLEEAYEEARADTQDGHLRELELESLKRLMNQLKEETVRMESLMPARRTRRVLSEVELANTRRKLAELERLYDTPDEAETRDDAGLRSRHSLKKLINQLKEEIIWTEVHQPPRDPRGANPTA